MKRAYLLSLITANIADGEVIGCEQYLEYTSKGATKLLREFTMANDPTITYVSEYSTCQKGVRKELSDGEYVKTNVSFYARIKLVEVEEYDLQELEVDFDVEMEITRTYNITVRVEATDADDAREKANDNMRDGDYESDIECNGYDDEDIEFNDIYEV